MRLQQSLFVILALLTLLSGTARLQAADAPAKPPAPAAADVVPERVMGKAEAPITVQEFVSLTCSHCAEFYTTVLPELEKRYVDTGKVRFILRDFPLDGPGLKAATLARCLPADQYYPFVNILYKNQMQWAVAPAPEQILIQYAGMSGLSADKAKACLANTALIDGIVAKRTEASQKYDINATPTFIVNDGAEKLVGSRTVDEFAAVLDRLLAAKK